MLDDHSICNARIKNLFKVSHTVSVSCLAVSIDRQDGARDMPGGGDWNKKLK